MPAVPVIETERLILRDWREADKDPFAALNADPDVMEHFPAMLSREESDSLVDHASSVLAETGRGWWATEVKSTGQLIGFIGLDAPGFGGSFEPCIEIGWRLAKSSWGSGFAPEGAAAALEFAFTNVDLPNDEVVSFTTEKNVKSRRVMDKIGLVHDPSRDFDHPLAPNWSGRHHVLYAIGRARWEGATLRSE